MFHFLRQTSRDYCTDIYHGKPTGEISGEIWIWRDENDEKAGDSESEGTSAKAKEADETWQRVINLGNPL